MKKFFKRVPTLVVVSLIIVLTVVFTVAVANNDVAAWLTDYVMGNAEDIDENGKINILDAIALYNNSTIENDPNWTNIY